MDMLRNLQILEGGNVHDLQHGLQGCEIRPSEEGRGLGIFATRDLLPGNIMLAEIPLLVVADEETLEDPVEVAYSALTPSQQESYRSLHAYCPPRRYHDHSLNRHIFFTNGFQLGPCKGSTGVFLLGSRFNHSCVANTSYRWVNPLIIKGENEKGEVVTKVVKQGRMVFMNHYKLLEGEEVTIDYGHKPNWLYKFYGFRCDCGGCTDSGSSADSSETSESAEEEDRGTIERKRIEHEDEMLKREWTADSALRRRRSLPVGL